MKRSVFIVLTLLLAACSGTGTIVDPVPVPPPSIGSFTASPPTIAAPGDPATLNWQITGGFDTLQLTDSTSTNVLNVVGTSFTVNPQTTTTYRLTVTSPSGSASSETTVVLQGTDPTPQPTPTPPTPDPGPPSTPKPAKPTINSFRASPLTIQPGDSAALEWNVSGATSLKIDKGVGAVTGTSTNVSPSKTTTYTLTATNAGGSVSAKATVTVAGAPEEPQSFVGRWLVTFTGGNDETPEVIYVYELDIMTDGSGKYLFCHTELRGRLCSEVNTADGNGYITGNPNTQDITLALENDPDDYGGTYVLFAGGLTLSIGENGRQYLDGNARHIGTQDVRFEGTVHAENVSSPRQLN